VSPRRAPLWRRAVDRVDGVVTPPANSLVRTSVFADTVAMGLRLEARLRRHFEDQTAWVLHTWNLPTAVDIRRVQAQLAALEGRVRDMSERLEQEPDKKVKEE